jgi:hypothetical protein
MSIIITDRFKTIMKRWITIKYPKCNAIMDNLKSEKDDDELYKFRDLDNMADLYIGEIKLEIKLDFDDDDDDDIIWDSIDLYFKISFNKVCFINVSDKTENALFKIIDELIEFTVCSDCISHKVIKDGVCDICYPWITTQEDDCCICLDNKPKVWTKLKCGHILHSSCFKQQHNTKCPLCRVDNTSYSAELV